MKLSYNWLSEYVDISDIDPYEVAERLTMSTSEIEGIHEVGDGLNGVVIGKILEVSPHPSSDHLYVAKVDVGKQLLTVVSGAPNTIKGSFIPVALPGAKLPGGINVKPAKLKGVLSEGVVCSEKELAVSDDHTGLWLLDREKVDSNALSPGKPITDVFPTRDYIIEIDNKSLTNRPDLWGHYGFARELSAIFKRELKSLFSEEERELVLGFKDGEKIEVEIWDRDLCQRYTVIMMSGINVGKSSYLLRRRLFTLGVRPINNIVDVTNYIMLLTGQPLHAFDADKVAGGKIIVRRAEDGEVVTTLDGIDRRLGKDNLVIADPEKAVAIAGVMGGANSEIGESTERILIESANFNGVNIRRTALKIGLRTEASNRFEKSLDPALTIDGLIGSVLLIKKEVEGAEIASPIADCNYADLKPKKIFLDCNWVSRILGTEIKEEEIIDILQLLLFKVEKEKGDRLLVTVPSFRATKDVTIPYDLVEEIGRIYGYNRISPELPDIKSTPPPKDREIFFIRDLKRISSLELGFTEVYTYSFQEDAFLDMFYKSGEKFVELFNPVSSTMSKMRRSLIPGLFPLIEKNHRYREEFSVYEIGSVYIPISMGGETRNNSTTEGKPADAGLLPDERRIYSALVLKRNNEKGVFFYLKGKLESLFSRLYVDDFDFVAFEDRDVPELFVKTLGGNGEIFHPSRRALVEAGGKLVGYMGELNPRLLKAIGIDYRRFRVAVFEIDVEELLEVVEECSEKKKYIKLPRFPEVALAIAVVVDEKVPVKEIADFIKGCNVKLLERIELFDIYRGAPLPAGKKNVAFNLYYRHSSRTLTEDEANAEHEKIARLIREHGWDLR